jgi:glycosyltransferase involved in cell wall biosynthesis
VATLHDLSVLHHPEWHPADRVARFERHFEKGLGQCLHFLTDTEFCRREVIDVLGIAPDRVTCTHLGPRPGLRPMPADEVAQELSQLHLPPRYLLHLGTIEPRKNLLVLMKAYCALPSVLRDQCPLLLVGGWGWNARAMADYFHDEGRHRGVLRCGYVADEQLAAIYNGALALVFPSHYEGFGLPPLEMMACGGAVLSSTAGAIVETVGRQAFLTPADDLDGWRAAMERVITDEDWRQTLRQGSLETARPFTWKRCAADTLRVYHRLCDGTAASSLPPRMAA